MGHDNRAPHRILCPFDTGLEPFCCLTRGFCPEDNIISMNEMLFHGSAELIIRQVGYAPTTLLAESRINRDRQLEASGKNFSSLPGLRLRAHNNPVTAGMPDGFCEPFDSILCIGFKRPQLRWYFRIDHRPCMTHEHQPRPGYLIL